MGRAWLIVHHGEKNSSSTARNQRNRSSSPKEWENERSFRSRGPARPSAGRPCLRPLPFGRPLRPVTWPTLQRICIPLHVKLQLSASGVSSASDDCALRVSTRVRAPPRRGAHATGTPPAPVPPNTALPCAPLCAFSGAALRLRPDVRLPRPLPAGARRPRGVTCQCSSLLRTSQPDPAAPRASAQPGPTGPAVRCALLRVSGTAGRGPDPGPGLAAGLGPCRSRHRPPLRALGSSPPLGRHTPRPSGFAAT